jgi:hypothetical protein
MKKSLKILYIFPALSLKIKKNHLSSKAFQQYHKLAPISLKICVNKML